MSVRAISTTFQKDVNALSNGAIGGRREENRKRKSSEKTRYASLPVAQSAPISACMCVFRFRSNL